MLDLEYRRAELESEASDSEYKMNQVSTSIDRLNQDINEHVFAKKEVEKMALEQANAHAVTMRELQTVLHKSMKAI